MTRMIENLADILSAVLTNVPPHDLNRSEDVDLSPLSEGEGEPEPKKTKKSRKKPKTKKKRNRAAVIMCR